MPSARDGSLPRRETGRSRTLASKPNPTAQPNAENMPRKLSAFNEAQKIVAEHNRAMGLTRGSSSRALQRRTSNVKESTRSQRFRLSDEDSDDDEDEEDASQGAAERFVSQWFGPKRKGKEKAVDAVDVDAGSPVRVKAERRNSQSSTQNQRAGASMTQSESAVIDLTFQTTDDEAPQPTTQKSKSSKSTTSGSQRSMTAKAAVKRKKTPPGAVKESVDKARLKRMMSGGSGKSEGDSIVLLDTDEEDAIKPAVSKSIVKPSPSQRDASLKKTLKPSPAKALDPAPATSHSQTMAQWRNTAPPTSSARQLSQSNSSSSVVSLHPHSSQTSKPPPPLFTELPPTSPSKGRSPPKTSQTSELAVRDSKRMELTGPRITGITSDVEMDGNVPTKQDGMLQPAMAGPSVPQRTPRGTIRMLSVEIPLPPRRSSRTPTRNPGLSQSSIKSPMKVAVGSPLREATTVKTPIKASNKTPTRPPAKTPTRTPTRTPGKHGNVIATPLRNSATPQSSILSSVSSRSRDGSNTPQQKSELPVTTEEFDSLVHLVEDVPVKFSDGLVPQGLQQAAAELMTPTKGNNSQSSRLLGKSQSLVTPVSQQSHDIFHSASGLSVSSSLPHNSQRDLLSVHSPSKRASMDRTVSVRQHPKSVHVIHHQDFLANAAGKRKIPGTSVEEHTEVTSPSKRRHLSPPKEQDAAKTVAPRPRPRRAKPVFAVSPGTQPSTETPISPSRSIRTDRGSAPNTPSKLSSFASLHMIATAQASPVQEYDTDRSYVSSSVMEEKMPVLIPYQRPESVLPLDNKMDVTDGLDVDFKLGDDIDMAEPVDENADLLDLFGDFDWTSDQPQPEIPVEHTLSTTPISKSVEEAEESLIDSVLQNSPTQSLSGNVSHTSPRMDATTESHTTPDTSKSNVASKKALDIFAELKAKHDQDELEKRKKEEDARKKMLEDSDEGESDDDLTSLLVNTKPRLAARYDEDKGKGYGLRSSMEPTQKAQPARSIFAAPRASPMPAALAKMHREMKKEKRAKVSKSGLSALELAKLNLELLEDEQEAEAAGMTEKWDMDAVARAASVEEESESSGTEDDDLMNGSDDEDVTPGVDSRESESARLADIPAWSGVWEEMRAEGLAVPLDVENAFPGFTTFSKNPRLLMAVLPNMIRNATGQAPRVLLNITIAIPTHPIADAAIRMFGDHAPEVYDDSFWKQHLVRIAETFANDPAGRVQATMHWLRCLTIVLRRCRVSDDALSGLVLLLVKLAIDRRSDFVLRRAVMDCINEALKGTSEEMLIALASVLADFSKPYASRKMRVRIAQVLGVASAKARSLKRMFALQCLASRKVEEMTVSSLPRLIKDNSLTLATKSHSPRGILSAVRMLVVALTHVHDVIDDVGDAGWKNRDATMSEADARKPEWEVRRMVVGPWRGEMLDALRWLKSGLFNKGKRTSAFRQVASSELTNFLNRFEQSSKYYLDMLRPPVQTSGFFNVKSERGTPAPEAAGEGRASSVVGRYESPGVGTQRPGARPKPMRRVVKTEV